MQTNNYRNCTGLVDATWYAKEKDALYHTKIVKLRAGGQWRYRVYWYGDKTKVAHHEQKKAEIKTIPLG